MPTTREVFRADFSSGGSDLTSGPLMKLICVWIIENPDRETLIADLAVACGCGERSMYRALDQLVDRGIVAKTIVGRGTAKRTKMRIVKLPAIFTVGI